MQLNQSAHDRQTESAARRSTPGYPIETLEDALQITTRDSRPIVRHRDADFSCRAFDSDGNSSILTTVFLGVPQQVAQHSAESFGIHRRGHRLPRVREHQSLSASLNER